VSSLTFAPVMERIFFRGFVFGGLRGRFGPVPAAVASSLLLGLLHAGHPGAIYVIVPMCNGRRALRRGYWYSSFILRTMATRFLFNLVGLFISLAFS
jgi:membrane protease YdiL (CAAX protease family)